MFRLNSSTRIDPTPPTYYDVKPRIESKTDEPEPIADSRTFQNDPAEGSSPENGVTFVDLIVQSSPSKSNEISSISNMSSSYFRKGKYLGEENR